MADDKIPNLDPHSALEPPPKNSVLRTPDGAGGVFHPVLLGRLVEDHSRSIPWVWEPFLAEGSLNLLVAFMKTGKSTLASALALAVAQWKPFLGFPVQAGWVLFLALEEHPRDVARRFAAFGWESGDPIWIHHGPLSNSAHTREQVRAFLESHDIKLVIVDTLTRFWRVRDENSNAEIVREVSPLLDLARDSGAAIVLVHHERKSGGDEGRGIRGASSLFALVDQALILDRRHGGSAKDRVLSAFGRYADTPDELVLTLDGVNYRLLGTADELGQDGIDRRVLEALASGPRTRESLQDALGVSYKVVTNSLARLESRVIRGGSGTKGNRFTYRLRDVVLDPASMAATLPDRTVP